VVVLTGSSSSEHVAMLAHCLVHLGLDHAVDEQFKTLLESEWGEKCSCARPTRASVEGEWREGGARAKGECRESGEREGSE